MSGCCQVPDGRFRIVVAAADALLAVTAPMGDLTAA